MSDNVKPEIKESSAGGDEDRLTIRVAAPDQSELQFKLRKTTPLKKLMAAFCTQKQLDRGAVRFMFDGKPVQENQTPDELEMEDGDVLDAMLMQVCAMVMVMMVKTIYTVDSGHVHHHTYRLTTLF